jgi:hypothetical protein
LSTLRSYSAHSHACSSLHRSCSEGQGSRSLKHTLASAAWARVLRSRGVNLAMVLPGSLNSQMTVAGRVVLSLVVRVGMYSACLHSGSVGGRGPGGVIGCTW